MNKNKQNIPTNTVAPANAEKKVTKRNNTKEIKARCRARRIRKLLSAGIPEEEVNDIFKNEDNRIITCLIYGTYTVQDGEKETKKKVKVPNILRGTDAVVHLLNKNNITILNKSNSSIIIKTDKQHVEKIEELLKPTGRIYITKPEQKYIGMTEKEIKQSRKNDSSPKKNPTNNTSEAKKAAKDLRKSKNKTSANMRPYYAAKRKGGISKRILRHNPTLAEKIKDWLKEQKNKEQKKKSVDYRKKHRQLTSIEMKCNKRARKAMKFIESRQRKINNESVNAQTKQQNKKNKPVQTELKLAA